MQQWLAAHQFQTAAGVIASKAAGSASESYQMNTDIGLKGSPHGVQAMLLDPKGCLAKVQADMDQTLQGRQSFAPGITSLHSNKQKGFRGRLGC